MSATGQLENLDVLGASRVGRVVSFDEPRGVGVVQESVGGDFPFHCSAIADGTRLIVEGTPVRFTLRAGNAGRLEANELIKADPRA